MMKLRQIGLILLFFIFSTPAHAFEPDDRDRAFFAISSLRSYLDGQTGCSLSKSDVDQLWEKALQTPVAQQMVADACTCFQEAEEATGIAVEKCPARIRAKQSLYYAWAALKKEIVQTSAASARAPSLNRSITAYYWKRVQKYLVPKGKVQDALDKLFAKKGIVQSNESLERNGFSFIAKNQPYSFARVVRHQNFPGLVFKLYPSDEKRQKDNKESYKWLIMRCQGAENIRNLIAEKKLKYFTVPQKWLYARKASFSYKVTHPLVLLAEDMQLVPKNEAFNAWKTLPTKKVLNELYLIFSHGYASVYLPGNIPYTQNGTFSCIDTEYPKRKINYAGARKYLSGQMAEYWDYLIKHGGP